MPKQPTLTQRRSIIENLWESGIHDISQLHKITHIPISTLYKYIKKLSVAASLKPKSRPGRPKKLTAEKRIHLGKLANSRKCASSKEIAHVLNQTYPNLNIVPRTVRENLYNLGYRVCVPVSVPMLTASAKDYRVEWAKSHLNKTWKKLSFLMRQLSNYFAIPL